MCSPARCSTCSKITWRGCGMHVDAVMSQFAVSERCTCHETPAAAPAPAPASWWQGQPTQGQ